MTAVISDRESTITMNSYAENTLRLIRRMKERRLDDHVAYATGFAGLDQQIEGGLSPGTLALIAGLPNAGKTAVLQSITLNLLKQYSDTVVIAFSLDDHPMRFVSRIVANLSGLTIGQVERNTPLDDNEQRELLDAQERIERNASRLIITGCHDNRNDCRPSNTIEGVSQRIYGLYRELIESTGSHKQVVVILDSHRNLFSHDYPRLASDSGSRMEYVGKKLKELCQLEVDGHDVSPIIIASDHLRKGTKHHPSMEDIKDSIGQAYDADLIITIRNLYQQNNKPSSSSFRYRTKDGSVMEDPVLELAIVKNKMGATYHAGQSLIHLNLYQRQSRVCEAAT